MIPSLHHQCAADYKVSVSDEEKKSIEEAVKKFMEANTKETIEKLSGYPAPDKIYASNLALETTAQLQQTDIFPSVKEAVPATGKEGFAIENKVKLTFHPDFANEAELLKEKLATIHGLQSFYQHIDGEQYVQLVWFFSESIQYRDSDCHFYW